MSNAPIIVAPDGTATRTDTGITFNLETVLRNPADRDSKTYRESVVRNGLALCNMDLLGTARSPRRPYAVEQGIALINIAGTLTDSAEWWDETEYGQLLTEVAMAAEDSEVNGTLLVINSPGGAVTKGFETAAALAALGREKPLWAVADAMAYSAAYLLATSAARIFISPVTGGVGSIGVYAQHVDISEALNQMGIKITLISAGQGKTDGNPFEPLSKAAREEMLAEVQRLYGEFVGAVASGRRMTADAVQELGAKTYTGAIAAIEANLADAPGDAGVALTAMAKRYSQSDNSIFLPGGPTAAKPTIKENAMSDITAAKTDEAAAKKEFAAAERQRATERAAEITQICQLAGKVTLEEVGTYITSDKSVAAIREQLIANRAAADSEEVKGSPDPFAHVKAGTGYKGPEHQPVGPGFLRKRMELRLRQQGVKPVSAGGE